MLVIRFLKTKGLDPMQTGRSAGATELPRGAFSTVTLTSLSIPLQGGVLASVIFWTCATKPSSTRDLSESKGGQRSSVTFWFSDTLSISPSFDITSFKVASVQVLSVTGNSDVLGWVMVGLLSSSPETRSLLSTITLELVSDELQTSLWSNSDDSIERNFELHFDKAGLEFTDIAEDVLNNLKAFSLRLKKPSPSRLDVSDSTLGDKLLVEISLIMEVFTLARATSSFDASLGVGTDEERWGMSVMELKIFAVGVTMFMACVRGGDGVDIESRKRSEVTSTEGDVKAILEGIVREVLVDVPLKEPGSGPPKLGGTTTCWLANALLLVVLGKMNGWEIIYIEKIVNFKIIILQCNEIKSHITYLTTPSLSLSRVYKLKSVEPKPDVDMPQ